MEKKNALELVELKGAPRAMGQAFGESFRKEIAEFSQLRIEATLKGCPDKTTEDDLLALASEFVSFQEDRLPVVHREFLGIAAGAGISPESLMIGNGFTDFVDTARARFKPKECTAFLARENSCRSGGLAAQNWDMSAFAEDFVVMVKRRPDTGVPTMGLTTTGCLSLVAMNEEGLCMGTNNLVPIDARVGIMYLAAIHHALSLKTIKEAIGFMKTVELASGHNYFLAQADTLTFIERTALKWGELPVNEVLAHANHYLAEELVPYEAEGQRPKEPSRQDRATELLEESKGSIDVELMKRFLQDKAPGDRQICVDEVKQGGKTCGSVVFDLENRVVHAVKGPPNRAPFKEFTF